MWSFLIFEFYRETNVEFLGFLHGVRGEFTDDVSEPAVDSSSLGPAAVSETSSVNLPRTPRKHPKT